MNAKGCRQREITELLPWYVNGTLEENESERVEAHLATCLACQAEVHILHEVAGAMQAEMPAPSSDLYARTQAAVRPGGLSRIAAALREFVAPVPVYARVALAVQSVALAVLVGILVASPDGLAILSGGRVAEGPSARIQVILSRSATVGDVSELLSPLSARIVDGPSALGVYTIVVPTGGTAGTTARDVLDRLRSSPLVEFAEIVGEQR